jgi:signal transduction histidine kinase
MVVVFGLSAFAAAQVVALTVENQVRARIATLVEFISGAGFPLSEGALKSMGELLDVGLATVTRDFRVRQSNLHPDLAGDLPRALRASVTSGDTMTIFYSEMGGNDFYIAFAPVGRSPDRGLVLLYDAAKVRTAQWRSVWPILIAALAAVLLANLAGWYIARSITRPLRALADSSAQVAAGDLTTQISIRTGDELQQLAQDFNRMVESLRSTQEELLRREKLTALGTLAAGVAHEIRNPLTSMKMAAQMLSSSTLNETEREAVEILLAEIERLQLATGALLDYAAPKAQLSCSPAQFTNIQQALDDVLKLMHRQLAHHKIDVARDMPENLPNAGIDPNRLKQVILNLILNAIEAMPEVGRLRVKACRKESSVELLVTDTGGGISGDKLEKIFEPFYSTRQSGCGLGLAISKRFVEDAGGSISVASTPEGTTFTITLPVASL